MTRRPYIRELPRTTWWLARGRYKKYMTREVTCIFIGLYTAILLRGIGCLAAGPEAYQGFLDTLNHPLYILFHLLALGFAAYNSVTWFGVTPKAMRMQVGEDFVPDGVIAGAHYAGWAVISLIVLFVAGI